MLAAVRELAPSTGVAAACRALGVPRSSYYRGQGQLAVPSTSRNAARVAAASGPAAADDVGRQRGRARALTPDERANVRDLLNSDRFADRSPRQVYATLLSEGQ
jgi:putative transposase